MTPWFDQESRRSYATPQEYVDEALRFDDVREGGWFALRNTDTGLLEWFKVARGKAVQLVHPQ